jgi:hypothetical protein
MAVISDYESKSKAQEQLMGVIIIVILMLVLLYIVFKAAGKKRK